MKKTGPASWSTLMSRSWATSPRAAGGALGRSAGQRHRRAADPHRNPNLGYGYLHTALDDHSRLAYTEILADETKDTAAAFLARAAAWYAAAGITIERVLSDNGGCYRSNLWAATCADLKITHKRTRPYRPQTNGKAERFHRTLADEWAYTRSYTSETERRDALDPWLHTYNHHRGHTALKGLPPASRVTNLSGQNT
jgi:transposase InsO family protein